MLCGCLALVFLVNQLTPGLRDRSGHVKGTDFLHFYVLGSLAMNGRPAALYDVDAQAATAQALVPESRGVYYVPIYGPQVSLLYAPLARLPYAWALVVWLLLTATVYAACVAMVWSRCPGLRHEGRLVALIAAASPAFFDLMAHGQNSAIALASLTVAFLALTRGRRFLAGAAVGMLIYKPQLGLAAACVFVITGAWPVVAGAIVGAATQVALAWAWFGTDVMRRYLESLRHIGDVAPLLDIKPFQMHSLLTFWRLLLPASRLADALYLACAAAVIVPLIAIWCRPLPTRVRYGLLIVATVLVSPHMNVYDLVILAPGLLLLADWAFTRQDDGSRRAVQILVYGVYALPLFGAFTRYTHVQLSVVAMTALFGFVAYQVLRPEPSRSRPVVAPAPGELCQAE